MILFSGKKKEDKKDLIEQIILEKYNQYYQLAYKYVHNEADASDIVQNGAYKAIRSSHTLKNAEFAATWIYRIMLNECFQFTKNAKHFSYEGMLETNGIELKTSEDTYENIDLKRALETLSEQDRAIIILKYFEDKTLDEIAAILEENVSTVKSRLYRSFKKLRTVLSDEAISDAHVISKER